LTIDNFFAGLHPEAPRARSLLLGIAFARTALMLAVLKLFAVAPP
jgi:hypothetical protein